MGLACESVSEKANKHSLGPMLHRLLVLAVLKLVHSSSPLNSKFYSEFL